MSNVLLSVSDLSTILGGEKEEELREVEERQV